MYPLRLWKPCRPAITYSTTGEDGEVTGNADWNTTYKGSVTLATYIEDNNEGIVVYAFDDPVSATVDGVTLADKFTPDPDGTLTVIKEFATAKRKVESVTVPTAPKTFTTYYGYAGYANSSICLCYVCCEAGKEDFSQYGYGNDQ